MKTSVKFILFSFAFVLSFAACGPSEPSPSDEIRTENLDTSPETSESGAAYPAPDGEPGSGYPAPAVSGYPSTNENSENPLQPLPDLSSELGQPQTDSGVVGGILAQEISDEGFVPLTPRSLFLAQVVLNDSGDPALMRRGDDAPQAELLPTGIFVFRNVPPNQYGIIIDVGFSQFPLTDNSGEQIIVTVEGGDVVQLGQILVDVDGN